MCYFQYIFCHLVVVQTLEPILNIYISNSLQIRRGIAMNMLSRRNFSLNKPQLVALLSSFYNEDYLIFLH